MRFDAAEFLVEHGVKPQTAADYLALRKGKKAAATATALRQIVSEASRSPLSVQDALVLCCSRGWVGFKAEWATSQPARAGPQTARTEKFDPVSYVNRNRNSSENSTANVIDITAERLA